MELIQKMNWRYATKRMNGREVPQEKLDNILEAIRLSASSAGLQPYKVFVIKDVATKEKLKAAAFGQPQLTEASHVIVFASWKDVTQEKIDDYIAFIASERNIPLESLDAFKANLGKFVDMDAAQNFKWSSRQTYIALGTGLIAAAFEEVDATPMEGFDNAKVDEILGLEAKGLSSVSIMTLGYRDAANDFLFGAKKIRRSKEELFELV
jgi:nitroreductase / dihydropteridine reductase